MTTLILDVPREVFVQLKQRAVGTGTSIEAVAQELLAEQVAQQPMTLHSERDAVGDILREAGLLADLTPDEARRGAEADVSLDEVSAALDRAGGPPMSELIMEMRGPKT